MNQDLYIRKLNNLNTLSGQGPTVVFVWEEIRTCAGWGVRSTESSSRGKHVKKDLEEVRPDRLVGLEGCFFSDFTGAGLTVTGFLSIAGFLSAAGSLSTVGFLSNGGFASETRVFDSFALTAVLSLCSRIDLSKINSMAAARWGSSPEEELPMISRSVEPSTDAFNFE